MTKKTSDRLLQRIAELGEANDELRKALVRHKKGVARAARSLKTAEWSVEAIRVGGAPKIRSELTEALQDFEEARHQVRLAMFALSLEVGSSISETGRSLGISRQLASRLADEARGGHGG
jgi:hypothetical protein